MKSGKCGFYILFSSFFFLGGILLFADGSTNAPSAFQESWLTISNRWSVIPLDQVQLAATNNDVTAQYYLGRIYWDGIGVDQNYDEAVKFIRLAAEQGLAAAQNSLGWAYYKGLGMPEDSGEAFKWYQKAADQGNAKAEINLAWMYAGGEYGTNAASGQGADAQIRSGGFAPNHPLAEKLMSQAVDLKSAEGQYEMGDLLENEMDNEGHQDTNSFPAAGEWFRKAAAQGLAEAQYRLADMYNTGQLGDDQRSNCIPWFLKAAAQGNADAQSEVGELSKYYPNSPLLNQVHPVDALRQSAEQGNLDAQYQLAHRYKTGHGVPKDPVEAFKWMQMAAQNDTPSSVVGDAIYELALMYEKGEGVTQDESQAQSMFLAAANSYWGQSDASFRVGQMYEKGDGVPQDDHTAVDYYSGKFHCSNCTNTVLYGGAKPEGAESVFRLWSQGRGFPTDYDKAAIGYHNPQSLISEWDPRITSPSAELYLGEIYSQGKLVPQDLVEAAARFEVAANQNLDDAKKMMYQLGSKLTTDQNASARARFEVLEHQFESAQSNAAMRREMLDKLQQNELQTK
jgi:TPR repeat protein